MHVKPWLLLPLILFSAGLVLVPAPVPVPAGSPTTLTVALPQTPAQAARSAAQDLGSLVAADATAGPCTRYLSLHAVPVAERVTMLRVLAFALNSLSARQPLFFQPALTDGIVVRVDLRFLQIDPATFDTLGELGSGPAPFPEPYFHLVYPDTSAAQPTYKVKEYGYWVDSYGNYVEPESYSGPRRWVTTRTERVQVAVKTHGHFKTDPCPPWLPADSVAALRTLTHSDFPILDARWFVANALIEPAYHLLLGTGENLADVKKLAGLDERIVGGVRASQLLGAVLFSDVALHNRRLERSPIPAQYGRGAFWVSYDFASSIQKDDVLADLLGENAAANETLWTLANGLQGSFLNDAKGKRLDKAVADIAQDSETRLRDKQVWSGYHCFGCHQKSGGWIPVDDEVRRLSVPALGLAVDHLKKGGQSRRAQQIQDTYLTTPINELVSQDQALYTARVLACTGQSPVRINNALQTALVKYIDHGVTIQQAALETGYPAPVVQAAIQTASAAYATQGRPFSTQLVDLATINRPERRDNWEADYALLQGALLAYQAAR